MKHTVIKIAGAGMWECFSYYGMRALLVLYMIQQLKLGEGAALGIYTLYTSLVEMGAVLGGIVADRCLGRRWTLYLGASCIILGHLILAFLAFYPGLALIIIGTALFKTNLTSLLGAAFSDKKEKLSKAYTFYYAVVNLGGFCAAICCSLIAEKVGWRWGFSLAAFGMSLGIIPLLCSREIRRIPQTPIKPLKPAFSLPLFILPIVTFGLMNHQTTTMLLPLLPIFSLGLVGYSLKIGKKELKLGGALLCLILFFSFEELLGTTLLLFCEKYVNRSFIPSGALICLNPLTIVLLGSLLGKKEASVSKAIAKCFAFVCLAFTSLFFLSTRSFPIPLSPVLFSFVCIAIGEICIVPPIFAYAARISSEKTQGMIMGCVTMSFAVASYIGGWIGQGFIKWRATTTELKAYQGFFIAAACLFCLLSLYQWMRSRSSTWTEAFDTLPPAPVPQLPD